MINLLLQINELSNNLNNSLNIINYGPFWIDNNTFNIIENQEIKSLLSNVVINKPEELMKSNESSNNVIKNKHFKNKKKVDNNYFTMNEVTVISIGQEFLIKNDNYQKKKNIFLLSLVHISDADDVNLNNLNSEPIDDYYIYHYHDYNDKYYLNYITSNNTNNNKKLYLLYVNGAASIFSLIWNIIEVYDIYLIQKGQLLIPSMILKEIYEKQTIMKEIDLENFKINNHTVELLHNISNKKNFTPITTVNCMIFRMIKLCNLSHHYHQYYNYHIIIQNNIYYLYNIYNDYHNLLKPTCYYKNDQKDKYYISYTKLAQKYKHLMVNEKKEAVIIRYNDNKKKEKWQAITDCRMQKWQADIHYNSNNKIYHKSAQEVKQENKKSKLVLQFLEKQSLSKLTIKQKKQNKKSQQKIKYQQSMVNLKNQPSQCFNNQIIQPEKQYQKLQHEIKYQKLMVNLEKQPIENLEKHLIESLENQQYEIFQ